MAEKKMNQWQFYLLCGPLTRETIDVMHFDGQDSISTPYRFSIQLKSDKPDLDPDDIVGKQATLFLYRNGEYCCYSGIAQEFTYIETNVDYSMYHLELVPRLSQLELDIRSRIFQKMTVPEIIKKVLTDAELGGYYEMNLQEQYPIREFVVQYQESDLNFISRLMEEAGIWYYFKEPPVGDPQSQSEEKMVISDTPSSFQPIPGESSILFRMISGLNKLQGDAWKESVTVLKRQGRMIAREVLVKNYNYRTPEVNLTATDPVKKGDKGKVFLYGSEFKDVDEADTHAKTVSKRIATNKTGSAGESDVTGFRAGARFSLEDHPRGEFNDNYLIARVVHNGAHPQYHQSGGELFSYHNYFTVLPGDVMEQYKPPLAAKVPKVNGILTAQIEGTDEEYASLDEMGRYKVRLPFDLSDSDNYDASKFVRLAAPYSGPDYGIHFPSHGGTEMVLACVDGNPNKIMGIGTIPNTNTITPVTSKNFRESVIRTAGKNEVVMDDTKGREKISVTTPYDLLENAGHDQKISIQNDREKTIGHDETNHVMNDRRITVDGTHTETIRKDTAIKITEGNLEHDVTAGKAEYHVGGELYCTVDDKVNEKFCASMETTVDDEIVLRSLKKHIHINAAQEIELKTGLSSMTLKSDGTIEIKGLRIAVSGLAVGINGKESVKVKGGSVGSEAMIDHTIKGQIVLSSGTATNTVKGAIVMLNP